MQNIGEQKVTPSDPYIKKLNKSTLTRNYLLRSKILDQPIVKYMNINMNMNMNTLQHYL